MDGRRMEADWIVPRMTMMKIPGPELEWGLGWQVDRLAPLSAKPSHGTGAYALSTSFMFTQNYSYHLYVSA